MNKVILFLFYFMLLLPCHLSAEEVNIPHKMALLHMRGLDPLDSFLGKTEEPSDAIISEMEWIFADLKHRSINPEAAIADTIYETWQTLNKNGFEMSILDTARELSKTAKNTVLFGTKKINFRMTSKYWLVSKLTGVDIKKVLKSPSALYF